MESRLSPKKASLNITISLVVFAIVLLGLMGATLAMRQVKRGMEQQELQLLTINTANKITKVITDLIWKTETLATLVVQGNGKMSDFEKIAPILMKEGPVLNLTLAPRGIVSDIYPLAGNESVLNLDYLNSGGFTEARWAKATGKLTLAGPFMMVQGRQGLTGRLPVYLGGGEFWGFVGIALAYPEVLDGAFLEELYREEFSGEIWRYDPVDNRKQVIWHSKDMVSRRGAIVETRPLNLFNVTWYVTVSRLPGGLSSLEYWLLLTGAIFLSLLMGVLCYHYLELRNMKVMMEKMAMTDPLTGLPNRRNIMEWMNRAVSEPQSADRPFVIVFADLNRFKQVNDTRGHETGDAVLRQAADILEREVGDRGIVSRVGGDEFIVFLRDFTRSETLDELVGSLDKALNIVLPEENGKPELHVNGSMGVAYYPDDGTELKTLLQAADLRMYNVKKQKNDTTVLDGFRHHFR